MNKHFVRLVAVALIPALLVNPAMAAGFTGTASSSLSAESHVAQQSLFEHQAIPPVAILIGVTQIFRRFTANIQHLWIARGRNAEGPKEETAVASNLRGDAYQPSQEENLPSSTTRAPNIRSSSRTHLQMISMLKTFFSELQIALALPLIGFGGGTLGLWKEIAGTADRKFVQVPGVPGLEVEEEAFKEYGDLLGKDRNWDVPRLIAFLADRHTDSAIDLLKERDKYLRGVATGNIEPYWPPANEKVKDNDGNVRTVQDIFDNRVKVADVPADMKRRGTTLTGPAIKLSMLIGGIMAKVFHYLVDWEDALADVDDNIFKAMRNLTDILHGRNTRYEDPLTHKVYEITKPRGEWSTIEPRYPGLHLWSMHFKYKGRAVPASFPIIAMYVLNNYEALKAEGLGVRFYSPKKETWQEGRWFDAVHRDAEAFTENELRKRDSPYDVPTGSFRLFNLNENAKYTMQMPLIQWVERFRYGGSSVGRWDFQASLLKIFQFMIGPILGDLFRVPMNKPPMSGYVEASFSNDQEAGGVLIGGMFAGLESNEVIPGTRELTPEAKVANALVLKESGDDTRIEAELGAVTNWIMTTAPGLVGARNAPFEDPFLKVKELPLVRYTRESFDRIFNFPKNPRVTNLGAYMALYFATHYVIDQQRKNQAVAIKHAVKGYRFMNDFATFEGNWVWLWLLVHHQVEITEEDEALLPPMLKEGIQKIRLTNGKAQMTPELFKLFIQSEVDRVKAEFYGNDEAKYETSEWPTVFEITERLVLHPVIIDYGAPILIAHLNEKDPATRRRQIEEYFKEASKHPKVVHEDAHLKMAERFHLPVTNVEFAGRYPSVTLDEHHIPEQRRRAVLEGELDIIREGLLRYTYGHFRMVLAGPLASLRGAMRSIWDALNANDESPHLDRAAYHWALFTGSFRRLVYWTGVVTDFGLLVQDTVIVLRLLHLGWLVQILGISVPTYSNVIPATGGSQSREEKRIEERDTNIRAATDMITNFSNDSERGADEEAENVVIHIPAPYRDEVGRAREVSFKAMSVGDAIMELIHRYPSMQKHLLDSGKISPNLVLIINARPVQASKHETMELEPGDHIIIPHPFAEGLASERFPSETSSEGATPFVHEPVSMDRDLQSRIDAMKQPENFAARADAIRKDWKENPRWEGIEMGFSAEAVVRLQGLKKMVYTAALNGAHNFWNIIKRLSHGVVFGITRGIKAQMLVLAGILVIYYGGWNAAAMTNTAHTQFTDQSRYPSNTGPVNVGEMNSYMEDLDTRNPELFFGKRAAKPAWWQGSKWIIPIVADIEAGFGGILNVYDTAIAHIKAGAAALHLEDQNAIWKKCGHMLGKVLDPTSFVIQKFIAMRLASAVLGVPTVIIGRTDADGARVVTSDADPYDDQMMVRHPIRAGQEFNGHLIKENDRGYLYTDEDGILQFVLGDKNEILSSEKDGNVYFDDNGTLKTYKYEKTPVILNASSRVGLQAEPRLLIVPQKLWLPQKGLTPFFMTHNGRLKDETNMFVKKVGTWAAIHRALAYAPYVDMLWFETKTPDLEQARLFAEEVHKRFPGKKLAYNLSGNFDWTKHFKTAEEAQIFTEELAKLGYVFQFNTTGEFWLESAGTLIYALLFKMFGMKAFFMLQKFVKWAEKTFHFKFLPQEWATVKVADDITVTVTGATHLAAGEDKKTGAKATEAQFEEKAKTEKVGRLNLAGSTAPGLPELRDLTAGLVRQWGLDYAIDMRSPETIETSLRRLSYPFLANTNLGEKYTYDAYMGKILAAMAGLPKDSPFKAFMLGRLLLSALQINDTGKFLMLDQALGETLEGANPKDSRTIWAQAHRLIYYAATDQKPAYEALIEKVINAAAELNGSEAPWAYIPIIVATALADDRPRYDAVTATADPVIKKMITHASWGWSWRSFAAAVIKDSGNFTTFSKMSQDRIARLAASDVNEETLAWGILLLAQERAKEAGIATRTQSLLANIFTGKLALLNWAVRIVFIGGILPHEIAHFLDAVLAGRWKDIRNVRPWHFLYGMPFEIEGDHAVVGGAVNGVITFTASVAFNLNHHGAFGAAVGYLAFANFLAFAAEFLVEHPFFAHKYPQADFNRVGPSLEATAA